MDPVTPALVAIVALSPPAERGPDAAGSSEQVAVRQRERRLRATRRTVDRDPGDAAARATLVGLLREPEEGPWCAEVRWLLEPLDGDPAWIPWSQALTVAANRTCGGPAWPTPEAARRLLDLGRWTEAAADLDASRNSHPELGGRWAASRAALLEAQAALHFAVGEHELAVAALREAVELESTPERRLRLGLSLMPLGEETEARAQLTVGLVLDEADHPLRERARIALDVLGDAPAPTAGPLEVGTAFPDLRLIGEDGAEVALSAVPGPLVLDLWATWCAPCVEALPHLSAAAPEWAGAGVTLLGASVDEDVDAWRRFVAHRPLPYATGWAGPDGMRATGLRALPAVFVLDADHRVAGFVGGWGPGATEHLDSLVSGVSDGSGVRGNDADPISD